MSMIRALLAALLLIATPAMAAQTYVTGVEDVPLAPGLLAVDGGTSFDSPQGRIVVAFAKGPVTEAAVLAFYAVSLPQLGWKRSEASAFKREGETLRLDFGGSPQALTVRFTIAPAP
ncbi:hypothetical protein ACFSM5_02015 [Lacibacterium aquatile]|uniref:Uncharacterized protein n=1 Tax=Lacibacterium aquatile TaxID=1168082 RepID=A0ABW5DNX7_9PROT